MAGKITIRRVGSILPTICLLLFLVLAGCVIWLSTQGFPSSFVRYVEKQAAQQGLSLHMEGLWLDPAHGLALRTEGVKLYETPASEKPLATVEKLSVEVSVAHLLMGKVRLGSVQLKDGRLLLPVTESAGQALCLDLVEARLHMSADRMLDIDSAELTLQGVSVKVHGSLDLQELAPDEASSAREPLDLSRMLAEREDLINQVYRHIAAQRWREGEFPSIEVAVALHREPRVSVQGSIPRFDEGQFHFRQAFFNLQYSGETFVINNLQFSTIDPEASVKLQGAYDMRDRRLSFNMESDAALLRMVRQMSNEETKAYLSRFRHPDDCPPQVRLEGDVAFEDDYSLKSAEARGRMLQRELMVGRTKVDELTLSFYYNNGNFNIDQLSLQFPNGSIRAIASSAHGEGQAQVAVDMPVQEMLALANELSPTQVCLPEELVLGERVNVQMHAALTTPEFKPGATHWQGFVPSFHALGIELSSDLLAYSGYMLREAKIGMRLGNVEHRENLMPCAMESVAIEVSAAECVLPHVAEKAAAQRVSASLALQGVKLGEDCLPRRVDEATLSLAAESAWLAGDAEAQVAEPSVELAVSGVSLDDAGRLESLHIAQASAEVRANRAALRRLRAGKVAASVKDARDMHPLQGLGDLFASAQVSLTADELMLGDTRLGDAKLTCDFQDHATGAVALSVDHAEGEAGSVAAHAAWINSRLLVLKDIDARLPATTLSLLQEIADAEMEECDIPELVTVKGESSLDLESLALHAGSFEIGAKKLVRTPHRLAVFHGQRIPIDLEAHATLEQRDEMLVYDVDLAVMHETGKFEGSIAGAAKGRLQIVNLKESQDTKDPEDSKKASPEGRLRVVGSNTIRPDVVDMLIDNADAHSIIRDFRFPEGGGATISGIDARVDYARGLRVDSFCHVDLKNTEYLICAIQVTEEGGERVRRDLGGDPYTFVTEASCDVIVNVLDHYTDEAGRSAPNESVVTISKPTLVYDNAPWLRRNRIKNGVRQTRLEGDAVIIDIEHSFVELQNIRGTVYPAYSLGMFYPDLQHYLEDVLLPLPAQIESQMCVFPIYDDCVRPMSGVIRVISAKNALFRFLGTSIPLDDFSGFVSLTDDYVLLDRMNAKCWEGVADASVKIGISGRRTSFDGYVKAQCMNLKSIAAAYGSQQAPALCNGEIRFRTPSSSVRDLKAYGRVDIEDGDLMKLNLFRPVSSLIADLPTHFQRLEQEVAKDVGAKPPKPGFFTRMFTSIFRALGGAVNYADDRIIKKSSAVPGMNHLIAYDLQEAHTEFDIINGHFLTRGMKAAGYNLNVRLNIDVNLDTLEIHGDLWPMISSIPTVILSPLTFLSDFMVDIIIYGSVDDIKWRIGYARRKSHQPPSATSKPDPASPKPRSRR